MLKRTKKSSEKLTLEPPKTNDDRLSLHVLDDAQLVHVSGGEGAQGMRRPL